MSLNNVLPGHMLGDYMRWLKRKEKRMRVRFKHDWYDMEPGLKVRIDDRAIFSAGQGKNWIDATVVDVLSTQFTCLTEDGRTQFRLFPDVGITWEPI